MNNNVSEGLTSAEMKFTTNIPPLPEAGRTNSNEYFHSGNSREFNQMQTQTIDTNVPAIVPTTCNELKSLPLRPDARNKKRGRFDDSEEVSKSFKKKVDQRTSSSHSCDSDEDEGIDNSPQKDDALGALSPDEFAKVRRATTRRNQDEKNVHNAQARVIKAKAELAKAQQKVEEAQRIFAEADKMAEMHIQEDADDLLLEPTPWNTYYKQLKIFFEREGHCNFKRTITDTDVEGLSEEAEKELRTLSWWTCRQRKFKRRGELDRYKIFQLDRLNFNWDPHAGPGPEKWLRNYGYLKEYKAKFGHVKVPIKYEENKLGSWLKTQITQYRNAKEGRHPALSSERIRLLEEIGVNWGEKRITTPWDQRYSDLLDYKQRFGHVNVPWQWKENIPLAQWVNSQRKKYKDLMEGKKNNLTEVQITKLNEIGFKWNTAGRGRYSNETESHHFEEMVNEGPYSYPPPSANARAIDSRPHMPNNIYSDYRPSFEGGPNTAVDHGHYYNGINAHAHHRPPMGYNYRQDLSSNHHQDLASNHQGPAYYPYSNHQQISEQPGHHGVGFPPHVGSQYNMM